MDGDSLHACAFQKANDAVSAMLRAGEDQRTVNRLALDGERQTRMLFRLIHRARILPHTLCRRGLGFDAALDWIGQVTLTQFSSEENTIELQSIISITNADICSIK